MDGTSTTVREEGVVTPLRIIQRNFDDSEFGMANIPVGSTVFDAHTHESIGTSNLLSSFEDYQKTGDIRYQRFLSKTNEVIWEIKDSNGLLRWKYALKNVGGRLVPVNATQFFYLYGENDHGIYGIADKAETSLTLPDGTLTPLHVIMGMIVARDGTIYATTIYPYTLLKVESLKAAK